MVLLVLLVLRLLLVAAVDQQAVLVRQAVVVRRAGAVLALLVLLVLCAVHLWGHRCLRSRTGPQQTTLGERCHVTSWCVWWFRVEGTHCGCASLLSLDSGT